jgi:integrase
MESGGYYDRGKLSVKRVEKLVSEGRPGRYGDGHGLYLKIVNKGNASWVFRWERDGRERMMGLGAIHTRDLRKARFYANQKRDLLKQGKDPLAEQAAEDAAKTKAMTFREAADECMKALEPGWKNRKHRDQWKSTLESYAYPKIGHMPVAEIDTPHIYDVLKTIWTSKSETASRVRSRIERVLDWAKAAKYRTGDNPAVWKANLQNLLAPPSKVKKVKHHAALPYAEMPSFMAELIDREGTAARALEFTILTAARTGEVIEAVWSEIDFEAKVWTVPAGRMEAAKEHRVPLSDRAFDLLKGLPREDGNDHIFIGPNNHGTGLSNMAMAALLERMKRDDITVHGFRSSFRDWAGNETHYPRDLIETALAHVIGNQSERAYRRSDALEKRRKLMETWAWFCYSPAKKGDATVVSLRAAAK